MLTFAGLLRLSRTRCPPETVCGSSVPGGPVPHARATGSPTPSRFPSLSWNHAARSARYPFVG